MQIVLIFMSFYFYWCLSFASFHKEVIANERLKTILDKQSKRSIMFSVFPVHAVSTFLAL